MMPQQINHASALQVIESVLANRKGGRQVARLRLLFIIPLIIGMLSIVVALGLAIYWHEHEAVERGVLRIRTSAQDFYEESVRYDASALQAVMAALQRDDVMPELLARRDRQELLQYTAVLFENLKKEYAITHFYFSDTERVNILRVHSPGRYGDVINRITTLAAEKNGASAFGVELGPLGTFTLRLVTPWYDRDSRQLIGYVELGMEIDRVVQKMRDFFSVDVTVLVHKAALDRQQWESGMRAMGRTANWDRFPAVVIGGQTSQMVSPLLIEYLAQNETGGASTIMETVRQGVSYRIVSLPLYDAGGRNVAHMVLITDVSQEVNAVIETVYVGSITALLAGSLLLVFFHWQVGLIGRRIERDERALEELATHDGLTGLYNHRTFYSLLESEMARAQRYARPLSLMMIDVDHFKRINDTYGHRVGDAILQHLATRISCQVRVNDVACRYGGEEIAVILLDTDTALDMAERLRRAVADEPFKTDDGQLVDVTVSIGVAVYPTDATTAMDLVNAADHALYAAKKKGRNSVCCHKGTD